MGLNSLVWWALGCSPQGIRSGLPFSAQVLPKYVLNIYRWTNILPSFQNRTVSLQYPDRVLRYYVKTISVFIGARQGALFWRWDRRHLLGVLGEDELALRPAGERRVLAGRRHVQPRVGRHLRRLGTVATAAVMGRRGRAAGWGATTLRRWRRGTARVHALDESTLRLKDEQLKHAHNQ